MYVQMPGIVVGLVCGWIYDRVTNGQSPLNPAFLTIGLTILVNALLYYLIFRLLLFLRSNDRTPRK
jgi:F0F1-type ATP synthase assembly protein I